MKYSEFIIESEQLEKQESTSDKHTGKIKMETEYIALREEKIFRYGYSNQLNTTLLTITLTVFTAGILLFTSDLATSNEKGLIEFIEYFFAAFFLLPCFFAKISFEYCLRNSLRIGTLSEYIRSKLEFENGTSWEQIKKTHNIKYFYKEKHGIGGAKDIPICVCIMSCIISIAIGAYFVFTADVTLSNIYWGARIAIILLTVLVTQVFPINKTNYGYLFILIANTVANLLVAVHMESFSENMNLFMSQMVYAEILNLAVYSIPQFAREILIANCVLKINEIKLNSNSLLKSENEIFDEIYNNMIADSDTIIAKIFTKWKSNNKNSIRRELGIVDQPHPKE